MPILCDFDTSPKYSWQNPISDAQATICFPRPLVARPRLPHGTRTLDASKDANIRFRSTIPYFTPTWADCHIATWCDSMLYGAVEDILVLPPCDVDFLTGEHVRRTNDPASVRVQFDRQFITPPKVVVFFNHIDLEKGRNWRLNVSASSIDTSGFTLHIETWGDTLLHGVTACWIAYPEDRPHIFSTIVNTMDIRPVTQPQHQQSKDITFGTDTFWKNPSVFVALNYLNVDCQRNLRVRAYVDGVSRSGLVCHVDSWYDTILYAAGASIIAFN